MHSYPLLPLYPEQAATPVSASSVPATQMSLPTTALDTQQSQVGSQDVAGAAALPLGSAGAGGGSGAGLPGGLPAGEKTLLSELPAHVYVCK